MFPALDEIKAAFHGGMSDAEVFLHDQFSALRRDVCSIRDAVDALDSREEWVRRSAGGVAVGGATVLDVRLPGPRRGFMWEVKKVVCNVPSGTTSIGTIYAGSVNPNKAIHTLTDADFAVDIVEGAPVFPGDDVIFSLSGMPANGSAACTVYAKELKVPE